MTHTPLRWYAVALCLVMTLLLPFDLHHLGVCEGAPLHARLLYPFIHASLPHLLLNAWCFLTLVFFYHPAPWQLAVAYAIAAAVPPCVLSATPTVGLSGFCFALLAILTLKTLRPLRLLCYCVPYIALGFILPGINAPLHLFCYVAGLFVGLITSPLSAWTRLTRY